MTAADWIAASSGISGGNFTATESVAANGQPIMVVWN